MTAHATKPTITPERVQWFAAYYRENRAWGVFHVCLSDGNWNCGAMDRHGGGERLTWRADVQEAAAWFDSLTPSQRRRLGAKAEDFANTRRPNKEMSDAETVP